MTNFVVFFSLFLRIQFPIYYDYYACSHLDQTTQKGYRLLGDVAFDEVSQVASIITPVPGGVGPITVALLLENTLIAAKLALAKSSPSNIN